RREGVGISSLVLKLDDAEQPVTQPGIAAGNEAGQFRFAAMSPNPAVQPVGGENSEQGNTRQQDDETRPAGRLPEAVQTENEKERDQQTGDAGDDRLHDLDPPEMAAEV